MRKTASEGLACAIIHPRRSPSRDLSFRGRYRSTLITSLRVEAWIERFLGRPGIEAARLGHRAACRSYRLHHLEHRGPADRLLIATAIELAYPLVTYNERIQRFGEKHGRQYRFAVGA